ncbi:MAG: hypothetical protein V3R29_12590 [Candidatus Acidoferrales bacterium]
MVVITIDANGQPHPDPAPAKQKEQVTWNNKANTSDGYDVKFTSESPFDVPDISVPAGGERGASVREDAVIKPGYKYDLINTKTGRRLDPRIDIIR